MNLVTRRLVDTTDPRSVSSVMRRRRWERFVRTFPDLAQLRVVDIGGRAGFWRDRHVTPAHVTLVNPEQQPEPAEGWIETWSADACDLPDSTPTFDLVFSNSVLEHVGGHWRRARMAEGIRRLAERHWVQTPNRHFPVDPHVVMPGFQYLPLRAKARALTVWPVGNYAGLSDRETAIRASQAIDLVSRTEMERYFPDSTIESERIAGLAKSLIAVRR